MTDLKQRPTNRDRMKPLSVSDDPRKRRRPSGGAMSPARDEYEMVGGDEGQKVTETRSDKIPWDDLPNIILLIFLYLIQGIPVGLAMGTLPFLLKSHMSFSDVGIFTLSAYPYSLKLLWSPIVDSLYVKSFGRRKSWIVPIQLLCASVFWWLSYDIDNWLDGTHNIYVITFTFFSVVFLAATQDIAVDGWAISMLKKENLSYASTSQTVGLNTGYFLSFTVFLAFNSAEFCNKYLRSVPQDAGMVEVSDVMKLSAIAYLALTLWLVAIKREKKPTTDEIDDVGHAYQTIWTICKLPQVRELVAVLLLAKIGFVAADAATGLKLLSKGFQKEDLALIVLIDFPIQIVLGYFAAQWSQGSRPLKPWLYAFYARLAFALLSPMVVWFFPHEGVTPGYFVMVIVSAVLSDFATTVQFVGIGAFFSRIADPVLGGTYMTLMNTFSNFGGTWPRFFALEFVDVFTVATCIHSDAASSDTDEKQTFETFSCVKEQDRQKCVNELKGVCDIVRDGYYLVVVAFAMVGLVTMQFFILPRIRRLERYSLQSWKISR